VFKKFRMPILHEVWIFDNSGISLINVKNDSCTGNSRVDPLLFSGILCAMESLSEETLNQITMNDLQLIILPISEPVQLFIVGLGHNHTKPEKIRQLLIDIYQDFWAEFSEIIPSWGGNLTPFTYFKDNIVENYFSL
jgi:hypothetical protein